MSNFLWIFFQAEDGIRDQPRSRGLGDVYKRQVYVSTTAKYESDKDLESKRHEILKELEDSTSETAKFGKTLTRKILSDQLLSLIHI